MMVSILKVFCGVSSRSASAVMSVLRESITGSRYVRFTFSGGSQ